MQTFLIPLLGLFGNKGETFNRDFLKVDKKLINTLQLNGHTPNFELHKDWIYWKFVFVFLLKNNDLQFCNLSVLSRTKQAA